MGTKKDLQSGLPSESDLLALRQDGDPEADGAVAALLAKAPYSKATDPLGYIIGELRQLETPPLVSEWMSKDEPIPKWVKQDLLDKGQSVFDEWSLDIVTSLFCASLPFAYAAADGVEVLDRISELAKRGTIARRIAETGQMLIDISEPGALRPGGNAYRTVRTVRLLHAAIRAKLTSRSAIRHWDTAALGVPVNQEDLLGTLLSFTTVVFKSLDRLGIHLSPDERAAYLHLWGLVGTDLGISTAELILDPTQADLLTDRMATRLHAESRAGTHLMRILMAEMESSMPWGFRKLPRALVRHLAGPSVSDLLQVPRAPLWQPLLPILERSSAVMDRIPGGTSLMRAPSRLLGRSMIRMWIDRTIMNEPTTRVRIDPDVLAKWKIGTSPDRATIGPRGRLRRVRTQIRNRQLALGPILQATPLNPGSGT